MKGNGEEAFDINTRLHNIRLAIGNACSKLLAKNEPIKESQIQYIVESAIKGKAVHDDQYLSDYFEPFLEYKKEQVTESTIRQYRNTFKYLSYFEKYSRHRYLFDEIDFNFLDKFQSYLKSLKNTNANRKTDKGLLKDSLSKHLKHLKTITRWAYDRGIHTNEKFMKFKASYTSKNEIVVLTEDEMVRLENIDLTNKPMLDKARDLFLFMFRTGQRISDINNFDPDDIKNRVWEFEALKVRKEKKRIRIEFEGFFAPAYTILQKYNGHLPKLALQVLNRSIKDVGKMCKFDTTVKITRQTDTGETVTIKGKKWEFMSAHMARRTFVSILINKGVPFTKIQKFTGHSDLTTLLKYEQTSIDEAQATVQEIQLSPNLKVVKKSS
ncbi:site-specific integrase [Rapidithrix thailandica]|uniref:Site-specific integrase n=1 Tax=Rapidithrix thailandica TaxID=413964 RepID=A0AAW9SA33_9BACT